MPVRSLIIYKFRSFLDGSCVPLERGYFRIFETIPLDKVLRELDSCKHCVQFIATIFKISAIHINLGKLHLQTLAINCKY